MSDTEEEVPEVFGVLREKDIAENVAANLEVLSQKTVNFEDLLNELVSTGCLSFEDKYKIGLGGGDDPKSGKSAIMYSILMKKGASWVKVAQAWEETGNDYLLGRFDTRFVFVGQVSKKSQKYTKFKSLPSHRTEFLTHLYLKRVQISPKSLLKCLRKSSKLEMIHLEKIKIPTEEAYGNDPSMEFDHILLLPNVKEFYLEDVTLEPFNSVKEVGMFLDELNLKNLIFFGSNPVGAWENGIRVFVKLRGGNIVKIVPGQELISMCRRRPTDYGGFFHPQRVTNVALYECYVPKNALPSQLSKLVLYRCRIPNLTPLVASCDCLIECSLYGEHDSLNLSQVDLSAFLTGGKCSLLRRLSLGFCNILYSGQEQASLVLFSLDFLCFDCCVMDTEFANEFTKFFQSSKNITWICGRPHLGLELFRDMLSFSTLETLTVGHMNWSGQEENQELKDGIVQSVQGLEGNENNFILTRSEDDVLQENWNAKVVDSLEDFSEVVFERFKWDNFCSFEIMNHWFNLPYTKKVKKPRDSFCNEQPQ
ncbi:unnamed protein product [Orchesella dallaii]|uniref:Uncharacterized protein n=1 Tax=Orchesella dallaii TaxID=48710 RepID=A0ABP1QQQ7_9HEXA